MKNVKILTIWDILAIPFRLLIGRCVKCGSRFKDGECWRDRIISENNK